MKEYSRAAQVALELNQRALRSPECVKYGMPTAPLATAAKAFRALAKLHKKEGQRADAVAALKRILELNLATEGDRRMLDALLLESK